MKSVVAFAAMCAVAVCVGGSGAAEAGVDGKPVASKVGCVKPAGKGKKRLGPLCANEPVVEAKAPAEVAAEKSSSWADNLAAMPTMGEDGKVTYVFGESRPTILCVPMRICDVELEEGEQVNSADIGDSVRWSMTPSISGSGEKKTVHVIIKPKDYDLDTNVVVTTDRRTYYLRLVSGPKGETRYTTRVGFYYPESEKALWSQVQGTVAEKAQPVTAELPSISVDELNFRYLMKGKASFRPVRVFDDGKRTYVQMPKEAGSRDWPALLLRDEKGNEVLGNYSVRDDYYVIEGVFDHISLLMGVGRDQKRIDIDKDSCLSRNFLGACTARAGS